MDDGRFDEFSHKTSKNPASTVVPAHENYPAAPAFIVPSAAGCCQRPQDQDRLIIDAFLLGKSKKTRETYARVLCEFLDFITKDRTLRELGLATLQGFMEWKSHEAHESRRLRQAVLSSFYSYAVRTGYLPVNLASFLPKISSHHQLSERYLTEEEVIRMITLTRDSRDRAIIKVLYAAGLRLSELVNLNWEHVQERGGSSSCDGSNNGSGTGGDGREGAGGVSQCPHGQLIVLGKGDKKRVVVISASVFSELMALRPEILNSTGPVFRSRELGSPRLSKRSIQIIVDQARLRAGITKRVSPHWLRHAHASHALDRGAPIHLVQTTLGHASIATTGRYLHARPQESSGKFLGI